MEMNQTSKLIVDRDLAPKFAEIYSFLQLFHGHLEFSPVGLADLEEFFGEGYDNFKSPAVQAHWQLLKGIGKRGDLYTWQSTAVKFAYAMGIISEKITYGELSKGKRLDIFKSVCDNQFDYNLKFKLEVNKLPTELLRISPIGLDMDGNRHWFFQDHEDGVCLYSDGHYQQFPVQPSSCRDYCRTVDELSCCINQLEAEVNSSVRHRSVQCNGEAGDDDRSSSGSSHSGAIIGCMKCHRDNAYEQMLLCDQCNGECHMYCLYPPLYSVPSGTWLCPHCDQKCLVAKLRALLFEAETAKLRHKTVKERMRRKVDRLARSGVNCGNIIMSDISDDDGLRRSRRSRAAVNYADLCDLDLTPIEERRRHRGHEKKLLTRAARYNILLEKRGLTSDAESSSKESCYSSDHNNEIAAENCDASCESGSEYERLDDSIIDDDDDDDDELYSINGNQDCSLKKNLEILDHCLDQSYDTDGTNETAQHCL